MSSYIQMNDTNHYSFDPRPPLAFVASSMGEPGKEAL